MAARPPIVLIAARDEADRLPATLAALAEAFPGARVVVADRHLDLPDRARDVGLDVRH